MFKVGDERFFILPFSSSHTSFPFSIHTARPQITIPSAQGGAMDLERLVRESRTFTCTIAGVPTPTVTWYHDNMQLTTGGTITITRVSPSTATLTISSLAVGDTGMYQCMASNVVGRTQASWALQVRAPSECITCTCTHTHTHTQVHNSCTHIHTHIYTHTHMHTHAYTHMYTHTHAHTCTHTHLTTSFSLPSS